MANTTLGALTLQGDSYCFIGTNSARKEAILTPQPLYLLDADQTDVFDYGGTIKTINLDGLYVGTSVANCKAFIDAFEATIQGHQDTASGYPLAFVDDYRGTLQVKVMEFGSDNIAGETLIIRWAIKLIQSSTNS